MANGKSKLPTGIEESFATDGALGLEGITTSDIQIPFVRIFQALSPQLKKSDPAYIEGADQGDIFNTVTNKVWGAEEGVLVLPVHYQMKLLEFVPRQQGGGFVGELSANSNEVRGALRDKDTGQELLDNGNELVRTAQHYVKIVHDDGELENAIVDMKKTQLKKSRLWNTMMLMQKHNGAPVPSFAKTYRLTSVEDGNDKGDWHSWKIALEGTVPSLEAYNQAKELHGSISRGELQIAPPVSDQVGQIEEPPF